MATPLYSVVANKLNFRRDPGLDSPVLTTLSFGDVVGLIADDGDWWQVQPANSTSLGYVARRYLSGVSSAAMPMPALANQTLWDETAAAEGKVRYKLGTKDSNSGFIDCSGWVRQITTHAFDAVNKAAGESVFHHEAYGVFYTHSDGIITGVEARTGHVLHGNDVSLANLREGMLIGCNFASYAWENDTPPRMYGIDHIVQVIRNPGDGSLFITQSSSSGNGVNKLDLQGWLQKRIAEKMMEQQRIHAADPFAMADRNSKIV